MKICKYISIAVLASFMALSAGSVQAQKVGAPDFSTSILDAATQVVHDSYSDAWTKCSPVSKDPDSFGSCVAGYMVDHPELSDGIRTTIGNVCNTYCNSGTCKKVFGIGGDTHCKAICCPTGNANKIQNCCTAAGDSKCCG